MITKEVKDLTKEELTNVNVITSVLENTEDIEKHKIIEELREVAKEQKVLTAFNNTLKKVDKPLLSGAKETNNVILSTDRYGIPEVTLENFINILENDPNIKGRIYTDVFRNNLIKITDSGTLETWSDVDDSRLQVYIEGTYNIYSNQKYYLAIDTVFYNHRVHPVKQLIESSEWDGKPRIDTFLQDIMKCEEGSYAREVSRMIFYGGINRLYNPGCKFDYMPILVGEQGTGKSLIVSLLGLEEYSADIPSIEGKDGIEILQGNWICEMGELLAMTRVKDVEAMKAYVSKTIDKYRPAYGRRTIEQPRTCIFIGTTNDSEFLTDRTGNRRYLPIEVHSDGYEIFSHKQELKEYILECWREALYLMNKGETYLAIHKEYLPLVQKQIRNATIEDPRETTIREYLDKKEIGSQVCLMELYTKALNNIRKSYSVGEARALGRIMNYMEGWKKNGSIRLPEYGLSKVWIKVEQSNYDLD